MPHPGGGRRGWDSRRGLTQAHAAWPGARSPRVATPDVLTGSRASSQGGEGPAPPSLCLTAWPARAGLGGTWSNSNLEVTAKPAGPVGRQVLGGSLWGPSGSIPQDRQAEREPGPNWERGRCLSPAKRAAAMGGSDQLQSGAGARQGLPGGGLSTPSAGGRHKSCRANWHLHSSPRPLCPLGPRHRVPTIIVSEKSGGGYLEERRRFVGLQLVWSWGGSFSSKANTETTIPDSAQQRRPGSHPAGTVVPADLVTSSLGVGPVGGQNVPGCPPFTRHSQQGPDSAEEMTDRKRPYEARTLQISPSPPQTRWSCRSACTRKGGGTG